jgi:hypothetical protein
MSQGGSSQPLRDRRYTRALMFATVCACQRPREQWAVASENSIRLTRGQQRIRA